jgi:hypothetical protein
VGRPAPTVADRRCALIRGASATRELRQGRARTGATRPALP